MTPPVKRNYPAPRGNVLLLREASHQHEWEVHQQYARKLAQRISAWGEEHQYPLRVQCFLMDLWGEVELLEGAP